MATPATPANPRFKLAALMEAVPVLAAPLAEVVPELPLEAGVELVLVAVVVGEVVGLVAVVPAVVAAVVGVFDPAGVEAPEPKHDVLPALIVKGAD